MPSKYTWLNGSLVPNEQATVPFLTNALHYGTAVFEGIRCYPADGGPAIFRLPEHVELFLEVFHRVVEPLDIGPLTGFLQRFVCSLFAVNSINQKSVHFRSL